MSAKMVSLVFERYPEGGGEMVLALAIADNADDEGKNIYPSLDNLVKKTRQARRTVQYQLKRMLDSGWLILVSDTIGGRGHANEYKINPVWINGNQVNEMQSVSQQIETDQKGAEIAPFNFSSSKDAEIAPFNQINGAEIAPFSAEKDAEIAPFSAENSSDSYYGLNNNIYILNNINNTHPLESGRSADQSKQTSSIAKKSSADAKSANDFDPLASVSAQVVQDFKALRAKKKAPLTITALKIIVFEAEKAGYTLQQALETCCARGWQSFKADWVKSQASYGEQLSNANLTIFKPEYIAEQTANFNEVGYDN